MKLLSITDQDEFGAGFRDSFDEGRHLSGRHHARFIEHEYRLAIETPVSLFPIELPRRQRTGGNAGLFLQTLRRLTCKRTTNDVVSGQFPSLAG